MQYEVAADLWRKIKYLAIYIRCQAHYVAHSLLQAIIKISYLRSLCEYGIASYVK